MGASDVGVFLPTPRIYVSGHCSVVSGALLRRLEASGYRNLLMRTRCKLDLIDQRAMQDYLSAERPNLRRRNLALP